MFKVCLNDSMAFSTPLSTRIIDRRGYMRQKGWKSNILPPPLLLNAFLYYP